MRKKAIPIIKEVVNNPTVFLMGAIYAQPTWSSPEGEDPATLKDLEVIFARIIRIVAQIAALALFVMLVVGGFKLLTSRGDPQKSEEAKNTMTYAVIGLTVIVASWLILKILGDFLGINLLRFEIREIPISTPS